MKPYKKWFEKWRTKPETIPGVEHENVNENAEASSSNTSLRNIPPLKIANENFQGVIPQFYFLNGRHPSMDLKLHFWSRIKPFFNRTRGILLMDDAELKSMTTEACLLPSIFSHALFRKVDSEGTGLMTRDAFIKYWVHGNMLTMDTETKVYKILKQPDREYLTHVDFKPILQQVIACHPSLGFLRSIPTVQEKYAETVVCRIFYHINRSGNGRLTLRELKRGNLIAAMWHVDEEEDIDKVLRYFSYQHFNFIFGQFVKLDKDCDNLIKESDIKVYNDHALTSRIVDRIFSQAPRKFTCKVKGKMNYEDFVYFLLSEGDKSSEPGIEYWFKCIDLDGNGNLTLDELRYFYEEQIDRIVEEPFSFDDMLCQIYDMIAPEKQDCITLRDLKRSKLSGNVFNLLFNIRSFYESRIVAEIHQRHMNPDLTEWDLFVERKNATIWQE